MSRFICGFACVLALALAGTDRPAAAAQEAGAKPPEEVATLAKKWMEAKQLGDAKLIADFLADGFIGVGPLGNAEDKRAFVRRLADPALEVKQLDSSEQSLRSHGQVVVVTGIYNVKGSSGGHDIGGTYRYVDVVHKSGARWMVISSSLTKVVEPQAKPANGSPK